MSSPGENTNLLPPALKSEKFPDPPMFNSTRKKLCLFITKLHLKLERNANQFLTNADKVSYEISQLEEDTATTVDLFYQNSFLTNLDTLIKLLKMIYDNISQKYTALTRLKLCH